MICPRRHRPIITEWERPRPWLPLLNQHEANSRAAITDKRPEPGFTATLRAAIANHPRFARAAIVIIGCTTAAQIGSMFQ